MATGEEIDAATVAFAKSYCAQHGTARPAEMTDTINPSFTSLGDAVRGAYDDYTNQLSSKGVTRFLGIDDFTESTTWRTLSDVAFDAQNV